MMGSLVLSCHFDCHRALGDSLTRQSPPKPWVRGRLVPRAKMSLKAGLLPGHVKDLGSEWQNRESGGVMQDRTEGTMEANPDSLFSP